MLCIDEVHEGEKTILFATDPLNDFTITFEVVDKNDQAHMDAFLQRLKDRGAAGGGGHHRWLSSL